MNKNKSGAIWGGILILLGIFLAGKTFGFFTYSIFFPGWWTLFIIIPNFIGLFNGKRNERSSNMIGLAIGVLLLMSSNGMIPWRMFFPLCVAGGFVALGFKMMGSDKEKKKESKTQYYTGDDWTEQTYSGSNDGYYSYDSRSNVSTEPQNASYQDAQDTQYAQDAQEAYEDAEGGYQENSYYYDGTTTRTSHNSEETYRNSGYTSKGRADGRTGKFACSAVLSGKTLKFDNEVLTDAIFSVVLGGIDLDLRNVIVRDSATIEAKVVLGGMDIFVPRDVRVVVNCTPILGGVDNKTITPPGGGFIPTIYINATCVLSGIDVKYK